MNQQKQQLPKIMLGSSKQKNNKLAKRLYKNNSLKRLNNTTQFSYLNSINPDSSILGSSIAKNHSAKNLLIPSISLKKNKQLEINRKSMQISHGKIIITQTQQPSFLRFKGDLKNQLKKISPSSSNGSSSQSKTLFKKLTRLDKSDGIIQKKILPDQLLQNTYDQISSLQISQIDKDKSSATLNIINNQGQNQQGMKLLKGMKNKANNNQKQQQQTLTPNDFIQLIQQDGTITNQFCYLKKLNHPYDLKIVEFQSNLDKPQAQIKPVKGKTLNKSMIPFQDQYITISSRGVSYFSKQNSRFVPLQRWKKQAYYFNKLMNLQFFNKYRLFKNFAKWKKYIRKTAMKSTTDKLKNQLLIGDRFLRKGLMNTRNLCFVIENDVNYCKFDETQNVMQFNKFKISQQQYIQNEFQKRLVNIEQKIKSNLLVNMSDSMKQFKQQNKISSSSQNKGVPLLIGDQKNLQMPYTKQATLRIQQQKFKKFLKLIQFIIVDSKIKMMNQSTLNTVKKIQDDNQNYTKQVLQTNYKHTYKGKQYLQCFMTLNNQSQQLIIKPTKQELNFMFEDIVNKSIIKLCRNHKRIINDDDIINIIYDANGKVVKQPQTNILKVIMMSDDRQQKILSTINRSINKAFSYIQTYSDKFKNMVELYFNNLKKLNIIEQYTAKDHEIIKQLLQNWKNQLSQINSLSQQHQSSIFLLNFREFKDKAIKCVSQCLEKMKKVIPEIFKNTIEKLLEQLQQSLKKIETKPIGVQSFIEFQHNKNQIVNYLDNYSDRLAQINCIWIIMKNYSSNNQLTNITKQQRQLNRLQSILNTLRTKLQQAQMNTKAFQTRAQQQVKQLIPKINDNIYKLYTKIKGSKYEVDSQIKQVMQSIQKNEQEYQSIVIQINKIKQYLKFLSMQEYNEQIINKFTQFFNNYKNIWDFRKSIIDYQQFILKESWICINIEQTKKQVQQFFNKALKLKKKITNQNHQDDQFKIQNNDIDVLSYIYLQAKNMKPLIYTIECLRDKSLGDKQFKQIKSYFQKIEKPHICQIIDPETKDTKVKDILDAKVNEELDFIQSVVFKSKKQLDIHNKMSMVNKFWVENSSNNAARNLTENFEKNYWDIVTQIDQKITVINGISQDTQAQGQQLKQNILNNKSMFDTLRTLLNEWQLHQRYMLYFEPIFMNSYWKGTNQVRIYNNAQNNWKKLLKQCKDYSLKRWASNQKAILTIRQNNALFQQLKKAVQQFLTAKRQIFPKFYFLSNQQLLHILLQQKDFKSIQQHLNKAFCCLKSLDLKQENNVPIGVYNLSSQYLVLKFPRINNYQIEELFKILQQSIKQSIKQALKNCLTTFEKDQFNRRQWIKQNLLQTLLFIQRSQYTKIIEYDYLSPEGQDLSQYLIYQNTQIKQLLHYLKQDTHQAGLQYSKIQTLIMQQLQHRQITELLIRQRVIQEESYQWQKQIRCYYSIDNAYTKFFVNQIDYGYEFINAQNCYQYIQFSQKQAIELANVLALKYTPVIQGKENLIENFSKFNAKHYKRIACSSKMSQKFVFNTLLGAYLIGGYVQFDQIQNFQLHHFSLMSNYLKQIYSSLQRKQKSITFGFKKINLNPSSGIILKVEQGNNNKQQFINKLSVNYRQLTFNSISLTLYINMIMQIRKKSSQNLGQKINKIAQIINDLEGFKLFNFQNIRLILQSQAFKNTQNLENYLAKALINIITQKIINIKKLNFYKKLIQQILLEKQKKQEENQTDNQQNSKNLKEKSDFKFIVNNIVEITQKKSICIIAGPTLSGKLSTISEAYRQKICRTFDIQVFNMDLLTEQTLFGCYLNDLWNQGILIKKLKQLQLFKQEWTIIQGPYNQKVQSILLRLSKPFIQLSNGQSFSLSPQWKFIFSIYQSNQKQFNSPKQIDIITSSKYISLQQSLYMFLERRIKPYFQNFVDHYNQLSNLCLNNFQKIMGLLKIIGYKNEFTKPQNILRHFINILNSILSDFPDSIKQSKQFSKGIQKIFIWSVYWALGSAIPFINCDKFQKSLFDIIKIDVQRSQNFCYMKLDFQNPFGAFKKIKIQQSRKINGCVYVETLDLKSKANFIQLMIKTNQPMLLTGKTGSGKSKYMQYLSQTLDNQKYSFLNIRMRKGMKYEQFKDILFKKTRLSVKPIKRKCFCPLTNKKLIILIDDINLIDLQSDVGLFLCSLIQNGFYYDLITLEKIYLYNIVFIVAQNDTYQFRIDKRFLKNLKPIYINQIQLKDITQGLKLQLKENNNLKKQVFNSCISINNFVLNLQSLGEYKFNTIISQSIAIKMMMTLLQYQGQENIAKVWQYLAKKKYTSIGISNEAIDKIQKQINNLLNLIIKDTSDKPKPVNNIQNILNQLKSKNKLLNIDPQYEEYYQYLFFLLNLKSSNNLLCINEPIPQILKKQILNQIAKICQYQFYYIQLKQNLRNVLLQSLTAGQSQKKIVLFLSFKNEQQLYRILSDIFNNQKQYKNCRLILDCKNNQHFQKLLQNIPSITNLFNIYYKKNLNQNLNIINQVYLKLFKQLQEYNNKIIEKRQYISIISNLFQIETFYKNQLNKEKEKCNNFVQKSKEIDLKISQNIGVIQQLNNKIKQATVQQETQFVNKKQFNEKLIQCKNKKFQDEQQEEMNIQMIKKLHEQINNSDQRLKLLKSCKNQINQKITSTQNICNLLKQVQKKTTNHNQQCKQKLSNLQKIQSHLPTIIFLFNLLDYSLKHKTPQYKAFIYSFSRLQSCPIDLQFSFNNIFNTQISSIQKYQHLFQWILFEKSSIVIDKNNRFLNDIKKIYQNKTLRIYNDVNKLLKDVTLIQPKIYIGKVEQGVMNLKEVTIIVNQNERICLNRLSSNKNMIQVQNSQQNDSIQLQSQLYKYLDNSLTSHIQNMLDQLNLLQNRNNQQNEKLIENYLQFNNNNMTPRLLNQIIRDSNIYYSTKDRIKISLQNVQKYQQQRKVKYQELVSLSVIIRKYFTTLEKQFYYFSITNQVINNIVKSSSKNNKTTQRTRKILQKKQQISLIENKPQQINQQAGQLNINSVSIKNIQQQNKKQTNQKQQYKITQKDTIIELIQLVLQKIIFNLKYTDCKFAYILLACYVNQYLYQMDTIYRIKIYQIIKNYFNSNNSEVKKMQNQEKFEFMNILNIQFQQLIKKNLSSSTTSENCPKLKQIQNALKQIFEYQNSQKQDTIIQKLIQYSNICLPDANFYQIHKHKSQVQIFQDEKTFIILGQNNQNPYQMIENQLFIHNQINNWSYLLEQLIDVQKMFEVSQKNPFNAYIIINLKSKLLFSQILKRQKQKQNQRKFIVIFLFTQSDNLISFKNNLQQQTQKFNQLFFIYLQQQNSFSNFISQTYNNCLFKFKNNEKPQIQKLSRIVFYQQINFTLKSLLTKNQKKIQNYFSNSSLSNYFFNTYKLSQTLKVMKNLNINQFIKILQQICFENKKQKQKVIFKQARKMLSKKQDVLNALCQIVSIELGVNLQDIVFQGSQFVNQEADIVKDILNKANSHNIINTFLPNFMRKKYPIQIIDEKITTTIMKVQIPQQSKPTKISQQNTLLISKKIQQILNNFPLISNLQSLQPVNLKKQKYIYKDIIRNQVKKRVSYISSIQQELKNYKKIIEYKKILSQNTIIQLQNGFLKQKLPYIILGQQQPSNDNSLTIKGYIDKLCKHIDYMDKFYISKQNQKIFDVQSFNDPFYFAKFYLYQNNLQANLLNTDVYGKYLNEKDKQIHFENIQKPNQKVPANSHQHQNSHQNSQPCKGLTIPQIFIKNAKFDPNKNILEPNDKNQITKISNLHICFFQKDSNTQIAIPLVVNDKFVVNFVVNSKSKQQNIWKEKVQLKIMTNENIQNSVK